MARLSWLLVDTGLAESDPAPPAAPSLSRCRRRVGAERFGSGFVEEMAAWLPTPPEAAAS